MIEWFYLFKIDDIVDYIVNVEYQFYFLGWIGSIFLFEIWFGY